MQTDEYFMQMALREAAAAEALGEIPVGAVITLEGKVIAKGHNQSMMLHDPTAHAEMVAITAAAGYLQSRYLPECTLYVTLEPCPMCAGALFWAQLGRLVYAAEDQKRGFTTISTKLLHPKTSLKVGVCQHESAALLKGFFSKLRN